MSERSQALYLVDIIDSIDAIAGFVEAMDFAGFKGDRKTFSATIRELEVIGEAVRNLSDELKATYPNVLWREIRAFRNKISHEYFGIDATIVWDVVKNELPLLRLQVSEILHACRGLSG